MSIHTDFHKKIDDAKDKISEAYELLVACLHEDVWGRDNIKEEYIDKVHEASLELLKMKRKL